MLHSDHHNALSLHHLAKISIISSALLLNSRQIEVLQNGSQIILTHFGKLLLYASCRKRPRRVTRRRGASTLARGQVAVHLLQWTNNVMHCTLL